MVNPGWFYTSPQKGKKDSAPPFKGGDSAFDSGINFIYKSRCGGIGRHKGLV